MGTSERGYQLGILPERKIDRRALATSYTVMVLLLLLLVNVGIIFPDRLVLKPYRVTELIPVPALKPEPLPIKKLMKLKTKLVEPAPVFEQPKLVVPREVHLTPKPEPAEAPKVVMNQFAAPQLKAAEAPAPTTGSHRRFRQFGRAHSKSRSAERSDWRLRRSEWFEGDRQAGGEVVLSAVGLF